MQEDAHRTPASKDEMHLLIEEGTVLQLQGTLDRSESGQQLALALGCSTLLGGKAVLMVNWLPGLKVTCHGSLGTNLPIRWDWSEEWPELHSRIRWWLEQPSATAPKTYTLQTLAGSVRMAPCEGAENRSGEVMRLLFDWHTSH